MEVAHPAIMNFVTQSITASKLLLATLAVTVAGDWFLFGHGPGLGTAIFFTLLWTLLRWNRPGPKRTWVQWGLLSASALQCAIEPGIANTLVLVSLTAYVSARWLHGKLLGQTGWRVLIEGLLGMMRLPLTVATLRSTVEVAQSSLETDQFKTGASKLLAAFRVVWPVLLVAVPFVVLLGSGNAILQSGIVSLVDALFQIVDEFSAPSIPRMVFWMVVGLIAMGLLSRSPALLWLGGLEAKLPDRFRKPNDTNVAVMRTWLLLVVLNVLFFSANTTDAWFLWLNSALPEGVNFSDFVHQGVHRLIACVLLAAVVLGLLFHQSREVVQARTVKSLAYAWIGQNLFLVGSVVLRLKMYVDAYQLTLLRLHLLAFLLLVAVGFGLLFIKIQRDHGFAWLLNANLLAVFWLFFTMQFINDRGLVAWVNYQTALNPERTQVIDVDYLVGLGAPAWPTLERIAEDPIRFPFSNNRASEHLAGALKQEALSETGWQSWQWRSWHAHRLVSDEADVAAIE